MKCVCFAFFVFNYLSWVVKVLIKQKKTLFPGLKFRVF